MENKLNYIEVKGTDNMIPVAARWNRIAAGLSTSCDKVVAKEFTGESAASDMLDLVDAMEPAQPRPQSQVTSAADEYADYEWRLAL